MLSEGFLAEFKRATEAKWKNKSIDPTISGFQFRPGTRWNPGLSDELIAEYQAVLKVRFPNDFKTLLREMNGTDLATLNVYASGGQLPRESVGIYSYPQDIEIVKQLIEKGSFEPCRYSSRLGGTGL
jgi:SMI1/KNR4 family protein SUKH-1